jgi:tRNA(adenine34) deaminase
VVKADNEIDLAVDAEFGELDLKWMGHALALANEAQGQGEVPVGAVIVVDGEIVGRGHNQTIATVDPTAHAEVIALRAACETLGNYRLPCATLYVTLEPCCMCAGAVIQARLARVVFAAYDQRGGACGSVFDLSQQQKLNHRFAVTSGVSAENSRSLLQTFFRDRR